MNRKAQFDFEDINPLAVGLGLAAGVISLVVARGWGNGPQIGILYKALIFIVSAVAGYLVSAYIADR
jgi:hypothetical protein